MSKTTTTAKILPDGRVVKIAQDGSEAVIPKMPMRPMTAIDVEAAAAADPNARPMTAEELHSARRVPRVKTLRRALGFTQEEFALRYQIPLGTLRDWEQGVTEPDGAGRAYLRAIIGDAEAVERALRTIPPPPAPSGAD